MEFNVNTLKTMTVVIILLAAFAAIIYSYPLRPFVFSHATNNNSSNITNSIKLSNFLARYNINLSKLSDKDLYYFYGGLQNNSIIVGCNYELYPSIPSGQIPSNSLQKEYENILKDIAASSICSVNNYTNCNNYDENLSSFIEKSMNSTQIGELFNYTYAQIKGYYSEINASGLKNNTIVLPLKYDIKLFNSSKNTSMEVNAIVKMKQMPINIVFYNNGSIFDYKKEVGVYGPFQFPVYRLINASSCSPSTIFNIVVNPRSFSSKTYTSLYKSLGNYTNICIITGSNNCNSTEMRNLNMSFYAN